MNICPVNNAMTTKVVHIKFLKSLIHHLQLTLLPYQPCSSRHHVFNPNLNYFRTSEEFDATLTAATSGWFQPTAPINVIPGFDVIFLSFFLRVRPSAKRVQFAFRHCKQTY